jgi:demethylmenaquinone methyltransferase/2-methoxy-6-polyprenyl-1,4-benzoquinol methylase
MTYDKTNPVSIRSLFNSIAPRYDLGNALLSGNLHRLWNWRLVRELIKSTPQTVLDLCAGTGEIARLMGKKLPQSSYCLVDFSEEMLRVARDRLTLLHMQLVQADAEALPLQNEQFDAASCAYGVRNINNRPAAFSEVFRVLKPGATFAIIELTRPKNGLLKAGHSLYLRTILPLVGKALTSNKEAYSYLCDSITTFVSPEQLVDELKGAGFSNITAVPQTFGIATLFTAKK